MMLVAGVPMDPKLTVLMAVVPCGATEELISGWMMAEELISGCTMSSDIDKDGGSATATMWQWLPRMTEICVHKSSCQRSQKLISSPMPRWCLLRPLSPKFYDFFSLLHADSSSVILGEGKSITTTLIGLGIITKL